MTLKIVVRKKRLLIPREPSMLIMPGTEVLVVRVKKNPCHYGLGSPVEEADITQ